MFARPYTTLSLHFLLPASRVAGAGVYAGLVVLFDFLLTVTFFAAALVLHGRGWGQRCTRSGGGEEKQCRRPPRSPRPGSASEGGRRSA